MLPISRLLSWAENTLEERPELLLLDGTNSDNGCFCPVGQYLSEEKGLSEEEIEDQMTFDLGRLGGFNPNAVHKIINSYDALCDKRNKVINSCGGNPFIAKPASEQLPLFIQAVKEVISLIEMEEEGVLE